MARVQTSGAFLGALLLAIGMLADPALSQSQAAIAIPQASDMFICGTPDVRSETAGYRPLDQIAEGYPLWFEQQPTLLTANHSGVVRFNNFLVVGDRPSIRFKRFGSDTPEETWTRTGTTQIDGRLVSVFNPEWNNETVLAMLRLAPWGWDRPYLFWGEVLPGDTVPDHGIPIALRMAFDNLPRSQVTKIADDVQFSSHVVNLVLPTFANGRVTNDEHDFSATVVTRKFYEHFQDAYDVVAIVPHEIHASPFDAFHVTVKNDVRGIGDSIYDVSSRFGSGGALKAYEVYLGAAAASTDVVAHETAHQWGSYIDWKRLIGIERAGHQPEGHDPLWAEGETLLGGLLQPVRRIRRVNDGWRVEHTPAPAVFHPYTRYAMGILPKDRVPEIALFEKQDQFGENSVPAAGTDVNGPVKTATIYNVIGMLGEREGPTPAEWRKATIVVSRNRLLTQREMDYWNFHSQRIEDPNRSGIIGWDGIGSFDVATGRAIDLRTAIRPKTAAQIVQPLDVDYPDFPATGWAGVELDAPVKSRYRANDVVRISGKVTARDRSDFTQVLLVFIPADGQATERLRVPASISASGTFVADVRFESIHRGRHALAAYLFWPDAGTQFPRTMLTTVVVE